MDSHAPHVSKRRRRQSRYRRRALVLSFVVLGAILATGLLVWRQGTGGAGPALTQSAAERGGADGVVTTPAAVDGRPVYRHSVVPGGVFTPAEAEYHIARDAVVAAHYAGINVKALRVEYLRQPRLAHVSYRLGNAVYWTRDKVQLPAGERVLTDGRTLIRARCGNLASADPATPVSDAEPPVSEFDTLGDPTVLAGSPAATPGEGGAGAPMFTGAAPIGTETRLNDPTNPGTAGLWPGTGILHVPTGPTNGGPGDTPDPDPPGSNRPGPDPPGPNPPGPNPPGPEPPGPNPGPNPPGPEPPGPNPPAPYPPGPDPDLPADPWDPEDPGDAPLPAPEPGTLTLVGLGAAAGFARYLQKRRRRRT